VDDGITGKSEIAKLKSFFFDTLESESGMRQSKTVRPNPYGVSSITDGQRIKDFQGRIPSLSPERDEEMVLPLS
jgi:hypothetical protein